MRAVRDIGDEVAHSIREYLDEPRNRKAVERLAAKLKIWRHQQVEGRGALRDKSFVLTGTLESMTRDEAEQKDSGRGRTGDLGGQPQDRYVVAGAEPGSKLRKALELGVKTLDERDFITLIEG